MQRSASQGGKSHPARAREARQPEYGPQIFQVSNLGLTIKRPVHAILGDRFWQLWPECEHLPEPGPESARFRGLPALRISLVRTGTEFHRAALFGERGADYGAKAAGIVWGVLTDELHHFVLTACSENLSRWLRAVVYS